MNNYGIEIGDRVTDKITGFKGIVTGIAFWKNGCVNATVQPEELKEGAIQEATDIPCARLKVEEKGVFASDLKLQSDLKLGGQVKHKDTRQAGIVEAIFYTISSGTRIAFQPTNLSKEGNMLKLQWLDEQDFIINNRQPKAQEAQVGGPCHSPSRGHAPKRV